MGDVASLGDIPIRDDLRGKSLYGAPMIDVPVTLNVNENTHPVPEEVRKSILEAISEAMKPATLPIGAPEEALFKW